MTSWAAYFPSRTVVPTTVMFVLCPVFKFNDEPHWLRSLVSKSPFQRTSAEAEVDARSKPANTDGASRLGMRSSMTNCATICESRGPQSDDDVGKHRC